MQCLHLKAFDVLCIIKGDKTKGGSSNDGGTGGMIADLLCLSLLNESELL